MIYTYTKREIGVMMWFARQELQVILLLATLVVPLRIIFKGFADTAYWYCSVLDTGAWLFWCPHEEGVRFVNQSAKRIGLDCEFKIKGD